MNLLPLTIHDDGDSTSIPQIDSGENLTFVNADTTVEFMMMQNSSINNDSLHKSLLTPGEYNVIISYNSIQNIDSISITADKYFPEPYGTIEAKKNNDGTINASMNYWSYFPDSTTISLFFYDSTKYSGQLVDHMNYGKLNADSSGNISFNFAPSNISPGDSVFLYYVVEDGVNTPFYSSFTQGITYYPPIYGQVTVIGQPTDSAKGFLIYLDNNANGTHDTKSTGGLEPNCVTGANGNYAFHQLIQGSYNLSIVLPPGYSLDSSSPNDIPKQVNYSGEPVVVNFTLKKEN